MDVNELLAIYDRDQRLEIAFHEEGAAREAADGVVRFVKDGDGWGFVLYTDLDATTADAAIDAQIAYFRARGQSFEWKLFSHDRPADLLDRLAARGFEIDEEEAVMVLDLEERPALLAHEIASDVRRLTDPAQLDDVLAVLAEVWGAERGWLTSGGLRRQITSEMVLAPDGISVFVAYADGLPASAAWARYPRGSQFAGLWGGSTLDAYRGRGLYTDLMAVRAQEAVGRGRRFLTVDASPMSRPILVKRGFRVICTSHPCNWKHPDSAA